MTVTWYQLDWLVDANPILLRNRAWDEITRLRAEVDELKMKVRVAYELGYSHGVNEATHGKWGEN